MHKKPGSAGFKILRINPLTISSPLAGEEEFQLEPSGEC